MTKSNISSVRDERNRTERKARYIRLKNKMKKYPECSYNNLFYCDQILGAYGPSYCADFSFFHTKKKRYYACCLRTCDLEGYNNVEDRCFERAEIIFPYPEHGGVRNDPDHKLRAELCRALMNEEFDKPIFVAPSIQVKDYGPVAIGLWATVNKTHIDENIIREFIAFFRSLGEPTKAGWCWKDEEIQVDPRKLDARADAT